MNTKAVQFLNSYISSIPTHIVYPKEYFEHLSYSKWIAEEILHRVEVSNKPATLIVEELIFKLNKWACINPKTSFIFSTAHDTAVDILDHLLSMKGDNHE